MKKSNKRDLKNSFERLADESTDEEVGNHEYKKPTKSKENFQVGKINIDEEFEEATLKKPKK